MPEIDELFNEYRPRLFSIAYRMLGSVMDAEDMVQEAFLRWQRTALGQITSPRSYLTAVITRLCIDHLGAAYVRRESYVGPWLPEPLVTEGDAMTDLAARADSLSLAFLILLERLTPVERAVFLLHEVFDYPYEEIAGIVEKSATNCRQIGQRARRHVHADRPRFDSSPAEQERLTQQFMQSCASGDLNALIAILADDITLWADSGGKAAAARRPVHGAENVARFLLGGLAKAQQSVTTRVTRINGQPGLIVRAGDAVYVTALDIADGRIQAIRSIANPEKLRGLDIAWSVISDQWSVIRGGSEHESC
jgi:RNA polymerase sigma-70 factor (ECF subfamily)